MGDGTDSRWRARRDVAVALGFSLTVYALAARLNLFERFADWSAGLERWQVDELPFLALALAISLAALRRRQRNRVLADLRRMAMRDPLTGLPNRLLLDDRLRLALARRARGGGVVAVLYLDLDAFKAINDRLGHAAGDELLKALAARLTATLRPQDTLARLGGDEFVAVCEGLRSPAEAVELAQRILRTVADPLQVADRSLSLSCSVGVAVTDGAPLDADALLQRADSAMYAAKAGGSGRYVLAPPPGTA